MLFYALMLFYLMLIQSEEKSDLKKVVLYISFLVITICYGMPRFIRIVTKDIEMPYSAAKDMSEYINENVPKNSTILVDTIVITQSLIPYLDEGYSLYDISYQKTSTTGQSMSDDKKKKNKALENIGDKYKDKYLIISNNAVKFNDITPEHESKALEEERYTLYKLP